MTNPATIYRRLGRFLELHPDATGAPSLRAVVNVRNYGPAEKFQLLKYLETGHPLVTSAERSHDVLDAPDYPAGNRSVLTDGRWIWDDVLYYYVYRYDIALPSDFIAEVMRAEGVVPDGAAFDRGAVAAALNEGRFADVY